MLGIFLYSSLPFAGRTVESTSVPMRMTMPERASPLFQPICLLMQEKQEWIGTPKQFKEIICLHFPDEFAAWYRAPYKYVDELKKITPELRVEGIEVGVPPKTALVTLTRIVMEKLQHPE